MSDLALGSVFAGYRIEAVAGRGGMGIVYRATDVSLDRSVAIKLITADLASNRAFRERFTAESKTAASLDHPNVIPIFHAGEHEGLLFLVMRYVEGDDLRSQIAERGRLDPARAAAITAQLASALDAAHARGLVHRDVKPANVLVSENEHVYLTDFGLTKRIVADADDTKTGSLLGTLNYVAPEQIRGEKVEPRTDVYALGCLLFHVLTGRVPFPMESQEAKLWAHVSEPPPKVGSVVSGVPQAFDDVISRAMAKSPSDRFESAGAMGRAVLAAADAPVPGVPVSDEAARPARPDARRDQRRALVRNALRDPFNIAILVAMLGAGLLLHAHVAVVPLAVLVYAAAATRTYLDGDVRREVLERERAKRRKRLDRAERELEPSSFSPRIAELLTRASERETRVRDAIDRAELPYTEATNEVERLLTTMRQTAARGELLHQCLQDDPPEAIARRLEELSAERDAGRSELIGALKQQLTVQRRMEVQLRRFYDQMEQLLIELDAVRSHLLTASASDDADNQVGIAAEVRDLREDMGEVADGMAAAYDQQAGSKGLLMLEPY